MLAPKFWYPENNEKSFSSLALVPLGHIYSLLSKFRMSNWSKKSKQKPKKKSVNDFFNLEIIYSSRPTTSVEIFFPDFFLNHHARETRARGSNRSRPWWRTKKIKIYKFFF